MSTEVVIAPIGGVGQMLGGIFLGPAAFDPLAGYPPAAFDPPTYGFAPALDEDAPVYAGTVPGALSGAPVDLFCLDIRTATAEGLGYAARRWRSTGVANLGAAGRVVAGAGARRETPQGAAATQLAVWFFTDNVVVAPTSPIYPLVESIVSAVLSKGPLSEPRRRGVGTVLHYLPTDPHHPVPAKAQTLMLA
jgi:hypothetical protein